MPLFYEFYSLFQRFFNLLLIACLFNSCRRKHIHEHRFLEWVLGKNLYDKALKNDGKVDFCSVIEGEWDRVWVVQPYSSDAQLDSIKAKGFKKIKSKIEFNGLADGVFQLVVENKGVIVGHGELFPIPLDLSGIRKEDGTLVSFTKEDCAKFRGIVTSDTLRQMKVFLKRE